MKIILLYPPTGKISQYNTPTGLLYIATVLKQAGYNVQLVDCSVEPDYEHILFREIIDTDILGVYAMSVHIKYLLPLLKKLKALNSQMLIAWGGPHAMLFPEQIARSSYADFVCPGEGESFMLTLSEGWLPKSIKLTDLNKLPFIDWTFLKPEVLEVVKNTIIRVQTSRGCPYKCAFCINALTKNRKMRYRTPENVLNEIEHVVKKYGATRIAFRDEIFLSNRKQARRIARGILVRDIKITWIANVRAEYLREDYLTDFDLKLFAKSGCTHLQTGGESGSQRILDMLDKGIKVDDILNFVKRTKKFGILPVIAFMTGLPTETEAERMETLALIREILRIQPKAKINGPANYRPYPGGKLFDMCIKEYGLKMPETLEDWMNIDTLGGATPPWTKKSCVTPYIWMGIIAVTYPYTALWGKIKKEPAKGLAILLMKLLSTLRLRFLFYKLPIEYLLLDIIYKRILKRPPEFS